MTTLFHNLNEWRSFRASDQFTKKTIGFVPTMGNLHAGHRSLLERSKKENDFTVLSILEKDPQTFESDFKIAKSMDVDFLLNPNDNDLCPDQTHYRIQENNFSKQLCGRFRPGHFDSMLTVMMKLLNLVKANNAYFGEKDYQQLKLIQGMVDAFFIDTTIVSCKTIRTEEGLALSSRNRLLPESKLQLAKYFSRLLNSNNPAKDVIAGLKELGFKVEYIEEHHGRRFGAVYLGDVRLIDNVERK